MRLPTILLTSLILLLPAVTLATIWHVPSQCPTIQAGIDSASAGDTVLVACGTYFEHSIAMKSGIWLLSETRQADCVTISAQQLGRAIYCENVYSSATIEGFTIAWGNANETSVPPYRGGGMYCGSSSPALVNCAFVHNSCVYGGGIACGLGSHPTFANCAFSHNSGSSWGGGLFCEEESSATLDDCTFSHNSSNSRGGGIASRSSSSLTLVNCSFTGNSSSYTGGAAFSDDNSYLTLTNCTFSDNAALGSVGGALSCYYSSSVIENCSFAGNVADNGGGAAQFYHSSSTMTACELYDNSAGVFGGAINGTQLSSITLANCTLSGNSATYGGGVHGRDDAVYTFQQTIITFGTQGKAVECDQGATASLTCCDVHGNAGGDWVDCIADQYGIDGNISEDLECGSPCAPFSSPNTECDLIGAWPVGCGGTHADRASWSSLKALYR